MNKPRSRKAVPRLPTPAVQDYDSDQTIPPPPTGILYPRVMSERETLLAAKSKSLMRFNAETLTQLTTGTHVLRAALASCFYAARSSMLTGIPNIFSPHHAAETRASLAGERFLQYYDCARLYASSDIDDPRIAPREDPYWDLFPQLWSNKQVFLVRTPASLVTPELLLQGTPQLPGAAEILQDLCAAGDDILAEIPSLITRLGLPTSPTAITLVSLPALTPLLVSGLAAQGVHAVDVGSPPLRVGSPRTETKVSELISSERQQELQRMHTGDIPPDTLPTKNHTDSIRNLWTRLKNAHAPRPVTVLDYGCGAGQLRRQLGSAITTQLYDPGVPAYAALPDPAGLVVALNVLEHVEPDRLDAVIAHIFDLASFGVYLTISLEDPPSPLGGHAWPPATTSEFWLNKFHAYKPQGWRVTRSLDTTKLLVVELMKQ